MNHFARPLSLAMALLLFAALALPTGASGAGVLEVYADRTEAAIGEDITWFAKLVDWNGHPQCAFFLYRDAKLIAYEPPSGAASFRYTPDAGGTYTLVALVRDGAGALAQAGCSVAVAGEPLRIVSVAASRPEIALGAVATWTIRTEGGGKGYFGSFVYRDGELLELYVQEDQSDRVIRYLPAEVGTYTIQAMTSSMAGVSKMTSEPIVVTQGEAGALALTGVEADAAEIVLGGEITWTASATGGEEDVAFMFSLYRDGALLSMTPTGSSAVYRYRPMEPGAYAVAVHAGSGVQSANLMSADVTVRYPAGVRLTGVACDRSKAVLGETITWTAQAEGASGDARYSFALYRDWVLAEMTETGASPAFAYTPKASGVYSVTAFVRDGAQSATAASAEIRVAQSGIVVDSVVPNVATGCESEEMFWTVNTSGGTGALRFMYFIYYDDEIIFASAATEENTLAFTPPRAGDSALPYRLKGLVSDGQQTVHFESGEFYVARNGWPHIVSIVPDRTVVTPGQVVTWTVTTSGGDTGQYAYKLDGEQTGLVDQTGWVEGSQYSLAPTEPDVYRLKVSLGCDAWYYGVEGPAVQVVEAVAFNLALPQEIRLPDIPPLHTPAPTLSHRQIEPAFSMPPVALVTPRPNMAPQRQPTPSPAPTLIPDAPIFDLPDIPFP